MFFYFITLRIPSRSKPLPLEILKFIVTTLRNQDKYVALVRVDEYGALERSSEFMKKCHTMNSIVQTTGGYAYSLNGKSESPNKILANIKIALLLNSSHKKNFVDLTISMSYGSPAKLRINCTVVLFTYSGTEQEPYTNTSTYGV